MVRFEFCIELGSCIFLIQSGLLPRHPFQTTFCVDTCSCWMLFELSCGMLTLSWILWLSKHHEDLLSWSQLHQRDVYQQFVLFGTLICLPLWLGLQYFIFSSAIALLLSLHTLLLLIECEISEDFPTGHAYFGAKYYNGQWFSFIVQPFLLASILFCYYGNTW